MENNLKAPKADDFYEVTFYTDPVTRTDIRVLSPLRYDVQWGKMMADTTKPERYFSSVGLMVGMQQVVHNFEIVGAASLAEAIASYVPAAEGAARAFAEEIESKQRRAALLAGVEAASPWRQ